MRAVRVGKSQIVQVVSIDEVTMRLGEGEFQEKDVSGAGDVVFFDCEILRHNSAAHSFVY